MNLAAPRAPGDRRKNAARWASARAFVCLTPRGCPFCSRRRDAADHAHRDWLLDALEVARGWREYPPGEPARPLRRRQLVQECALRPAPDRTWEGPLNRQHRRRFRQCPSRNGERALRNRSRSWSTKGAVPGGGRPAPDHSRLDASMRDRAPTWQFGRSTPKEFDAAYASQRAHQTLDGTE